MLYMNLKLILYFELDMEWMKKTTGLEIICVQYRYIAQNLYDP